MDVADLDHLIAGMPDPVIALAADWRVLVANAPARSLFGPALGRNLLGALRHPQAVAAVRTALQDRARAEAEVSLTDAAGRRTFRLVAQPLDPERSASAAALIALDDISQVEQVRRLQGDFVANVSHELKSPVTAISAALETLEHDPDALAAFLPILRQETARMRDLIADLMSLNRVELDARVPPSRQIDLREVVRSAVDRSTRQSGGPDRTEIIMSQDPVPVAAEAAQLEQAVGNLIDNALRYGRKGTPVKVELATQGDEARVSITDQGAGIAPEHLPRLTERFYRVDAHRSRQLGGTGLGLAIVKHVATRHRGRLDVASTPGQGSVFTLILPLAGSVT